LIVKRKENKYDYVQDYTYFMVILFGKNENRTKISSLLSLNMGLKMIFFL